MKEILKHVRWWAHIYSDHSPKSLPWQFLIHLNPLPSEKLIGVQEIIFWSSEWVGKTWTSRFKEDDWGRVNCQARSQISMSCPQNCHFRKVYYDAKQWGQVFSSSWKWFIFENFVKNSVLSISWDFFSERKQSWWKWNFTATWEEYDKNQISYNCYQNRNFNIVSREI